MKLTIPTVRVIERFIELIIIGPVKYKTRLQDTQKYVYKYKYKENINRLIMYD